MLLSFVKMPDLVKKQKEADGTKSKIANNGQTCSWKKICHSRKKFQNFFFLITQKF